jgi:hypothetical protein
MSYLSNSPPIVLIDYIQPLSNENIENIIHAVPINDENDEISIVPNLLLYPNQRQIKYNIISLSVILCCFSVIIITIAVNSINNNKNSNNSPRNPLTNSSFVRLT